MSQTSHLKTAQGKVVALPSRQLPFETWRPIFQIVYATHTAISHPPSDFETSNLNSRLNIYRCLARVSQSWRSNARDVFFEELEALTAESLKGLIRTFQNERSLPLVVSRISFCFREFRCAASTPRRPRPLLPDVEADEHGTSSPTARAPDWKTIHRRDARHYEPSGTAQGAHWTRWHADVAQILVMCSSISEVKIIFTTEPIQAGDHRTYRAWFPPPDLKNENILNSLLHLTNLRSLHLVDPTPLPQYGPLLASWERLKHLTIILTRPFENLKDTVFVPPKSLVSLRFQARRGNVPWPLSSDLARCTNLQVLELVITSIAATEATRKAIGFLCMAYRHSLRELTLHVLQHGSLQNVFESMSPLYFPKLQRLCLPESAYDTRLFSYFEADELKYVEIGWLMLEPTIGSREDKWSRALSRTSLKMLEQLVINQDDPDLYRKQALQTVCDRLGITLSFRSFIDPDVRNEEGEDGGNEVVEMLN